MQHYTVQDIMDLRPCQPTTNRPNDGYPLDKLQRLFGDQQSVTALDICDDERIPIKDRQWVLHRLLPEPLVHEAVCRYAEHALERERAAGREPDPRLWAAIEAKRRWLRGEISDGDLKAAESAAWAAADAVSDARTSLDASRDAASAAVWAASRDAASAARDDAVWDVVQTAGRRWQLDMIRAMIGERPLQGRKDRGSSVPGADAARRHRGGAGAVRMTSSTILPPPPPMWPWCLWHDDAADRLRALRAAGHSPGCQCGRRGHVGCSELRRRLMESGRWMAAQ